MGKQSSRLIYQGTDIKDLYYQDGQLFQLFKLYKGNQLVWEKLGDFCLPTTALKVFDIYTNEWERGSDFEIYNMATNSSHAIALLHKGAENYIAVSRNLTEWKIVNEIEYDYSNFVGFSKKESGFYVYNRKEIYSIDIESGLDYQISVIDLSNYNTQYFGVGGGISDYAYVIYLSNSPSRYHLMQISKNGIVKSGKLGYPFNTAGVDLTASNYMIVGDENVFLVTYANSAASGRETIIYKIANMDTDTLYTAYRKSGAATNGTLFIDIVYDNYQTVFLIYKPNMVWFAYYRIDTMGNFLKISEKTDDSVKQIALPLYGADGHTLNNITGNPSISSELTIKFTDADKYKTISEYIADGIYPYDYLDFYTASHLDNNSESLYTDNGSYKKDCVICATRTFNTSYDGKISAKRILIFIDNLFWEESENNYAVLIDAY